MNKFNKRIKQVVQDLDESLALVDTFDREAVIYKWFKRNFEQFHIENSITNEALVYTNDEKYLEYQEKQALRSILTDLNFQNIAVTKETKPSEFIQKTRYSILALKND